MEFTYRLVGPGWAQARLADGATTATLTASYLSDALADVLEAVADVLAGSDEARCRWEEEPGEYRWIFRRSGVGVALRVLWFDDCYDPRRDARGADEAGTAVFATEQPLRVLASAIADGAGLVLAEHGENGYRERWQLHPFPSGLLARVRELLGHQ